MQQKGQKHSEESNLTACYQSFKSCVYLASNKFLPFSCYFESFHLEWQNANSQEDRF